MKFSLSTNDKSTVLDEVILFGLIVLFLAAGLVLYIFEPSFWIISSSIMKAFGLIWIMAALMFIPSLIYRLLTNDKKE